MSLGPLPMIHIGEGHEGKQRPLVVVGRDQAASAASEYLQIPCRTIYPATRFGASSEAVVDSA